jgi:hypothetical protein
VALRDSATFKLKRLKIKCCARAYIATVVLAVVAQVATTKVQHPTDMLTILAT